MVRPERFELPTYCSGGNRSIQLSYGRGPRNYTYVHYLASSRHCLGQPPATRCAQDCAHSAEKRPRVPCPLRGERNGWKSRLSCAQRFEPRSRHRSQIVLVASETYVETSKARMA